MGLSPEQRRQWARDMCIDVYGIDPEALRKDAERYQWLRAQHWTNGLLAVVVRPHEAVKLGYECPSLERLDRQIDAAMRAEQFPGVDIDAAHKA